MNTQIRSELKKFLKKYGIKNADTIVRQTLDVNFDKFLEYAEPIYAIGRIISCYEDSNVRNKLVEANKEWTILVVERGWCSELQPLLDKYGYNIVKRSIRYLMEQNLWFCYAGKMALKMKMPDHWKGLADIAEAAEYIMQQVEVEQEQPEETETPNNDLDQNAVPDDEIPENMKSDAAYDAIGRITERMKESAADFEILSQFVVANCEMTDKTKEIAKLTTRYESIKKKYDALEKSEKELRFELDKTQKELETCSSVLAERNDEIGNLSRKLAEANDIIKGHDIDLLQRDSKYSELSDKYEEIKKYYDDLKSRAAMPVKRVIPRSALTSLPLIGNKALVGLIPLLEKYSIIVDENR